MVTKNRVRFGIAVIVALGLAGSCYADPTKPRYVPPSVDTTENDTTKSPG